MKFGASSSNNKVKHNGESPSRLWYLRHSMMAIARLPFIKKSRGAVKKAAVHTALFGVSAGLLFKVALPMVAIPVVGWIAGAAAGGACLYFGVSAFRKTRALRKNPVAVKHMRASEQKWLSKKMSGGIVQRMKNKLPLVGEKKPKAANDDKKVKKEFTQASAPKASEPVSAERQAAAEARRSRPRSRSL